MRVAGTHWCNRVGLGAQWDVCGRGRRCLETSRHSGEAAGWQMGVFLRPTFYSLIQHTFTEHVACTRPGGYEEGSNTCGMPTKRLTWHNSRF